MNFWDELPEIDSHRLFIALGRYIKTIKKRNITIYSWRDSFSIYCNDNALSLYNIICYPNKIVINSNGGLTFDFSEFIFEYLIASVIEPKSKNALNKFYSYKKDFIFSIKCKLI